MSDYDCLSTYDYKALTYHRIEGTEDWQIVGEFGSGGYEWNEFKCFYSPSARMFFWKGDSGCSCNSWSDDIHSVADFEVGDKIALLRAWARYAEDNSYEYTFEDYLKGAEKIRGYNGDT